MPRIRVFIVSPVTLFRDGLDRLLRSCPTIDVVGVAGSATQARDAGTSGAADVILLDGLMANVGEVARAVRAASAHPLVLAFAVGDAEGDIIACAEAGVTGYLTSDGTVEDLVARIEGAVRGETYCSPRAVNTVFRRLADLATGTAQPKRDVVSPALTPREREIVRLIDQGMSNKEIARHLGIEVTTVKNHVHHILDKLSCRRRGQVAARVRATNDDGPAESTQRSQS